MATTPTIRERRPRRLRWFAAAAVLVLLAAVAVPVIAAGPGAPPGADRSVPLQAEASEKPGKGPKEKKQKVATEPITLRGTVSAATNADGRREYRISSGGRSYVLDGGPSWFFGDKHPLEASVGKTVTIAGEIAEGSTEVDVVSVNGNALREPGRPPWAGGWKEVGKAHPGWSQEKADRAAAKAAKRAEKFGDCFPPGHCKQDDEGE